MPLSWLHLSDLRITAEGDGNPVLPALLREIERRHHGGQSLDLIFLTGLAATGLATEYALVTNFCDSLLRAAGLTGRRDRLVVVPSEHDLHLAAGKGLQRTLDSAEASQDYFGPDHPRHHFAKLTPFRAWYDDYFRSIFRFPTASTCGPYSVLSIGGYRIALMPLNTVLFAQGDNDEGMLWIGRRALNDALAKLADEVTLDLRIAVMHHPVDSLHVVEREAVRERLVSEFHLILHGHAPASRVDQIHGVGDAVALQVAAPPVRAGRTGGANLVDLIGNRLIDHPLRYDDAIERWVPDMARGHPSGIVVPRLRGEVLAGRYLLLEPIGRGGFGVVWKAQDLKSVRVVAVKIFKTALGDEDRLRRFFEGAERIARVRHPAVVRVLEARGQTDGLAYSVMEFVDGRTLAEIQRGSQLSPDDVVSRLMELGEGLLAMHNEGVVHRDLKPKNILVDRDGRARIIDFDTATAAEDPHQSETAAVTATHLYSAPEVLNKERSDARADIYSLAATGVFLLTGVDPPAGYGNIAAFVRTVLVEQGPLALLQVLGKAGEREQGSRYASVREMLADLDRSRAVVAGPRTVARPYVAVASPSIERLQGAHQTPASTVGTNHDGLVAPHALTRNSVPTAPRRRAEGSSSIRSVLAYAALAVAALNSPLRSDGARGAETSSPSATPNAIYVDTWVVSAVEKLRGLRDFFEPRTTAAADRRPEPTVSPLYTPAEPTSAEPPTLSKAESEKLGHSIERFCRIDKLMYSKSINPLTINLSMEDGKVEVKFASRNTFVGENKSFISCIKRIVVNDKPSAQRWTTSVRCTIAVKK